MTFDELEQVNEGSTCYVTVTFLDKDEVPEQPTTSSYTIYDYYSGANIKEDTALTPADGIVEITITGTENAMLNAALREEIHVLTVHALYGTGDEVNDQYKFKVVNLKHEPGV